MYIHEYNKHYKHCKSKIDAEWLGRKQMQKSKKSNECCCRNNQGAMSKLQNDAADLTRQNHYTQNKLKRFGGMQWLKN